MGSYPPLLVLRSIMALELGWVVLTEADHWGDWSSTEEATEGRSGCGLIWRPLRRCLTAFYHPRSQFCTLAFKLAHSLTHSPIHVHRHTLVKDAVIAGSRALITWRLVFSPTVSVLTLNPWSRIILCSNPNLVSPTHLLSRSHSAYCAYLSAVHPFWCLAISLLWGK